VSTYANWIDSTWFTSNGKFAHQAGVKIEIEKFWTLRLSLSRVHDAAIMDIAVQHDFLDKQLLFINTCMLYLQVITYGALLCISGHNGDYF
jgi:hypothetical protein